MIRDYESLKQDVLNQKSKSDSLRIIEKLYGRKDANSILRQIYAQNNLLKEQDNEYLSLFKYLINMQYNLGGNILEIGGGVYPVLSAYIDSYQRKIGCGTITVIDPNLGVSKLGNVKLIKDKFTGNIKSYDLIISQSPCTIVNEVMDSAIDNGKEFFVTLCECLLDNHPYLIDFYADDYGFCNIQNDILNKKRQRNINNGQKLYIDSGSIFYGDKVQEEMKYINGKKLIKK